MPRNHDGDLVYKQKKKCMQADLMDVYKSCWLKSPVSPLVADDEVDVDDIYVTPCMRRIHHDRVPPGGRIAEAKPVTYSDIFDKDLKNMDDWDKRNQDRRRKNIYIIGAAGMGKTTLCRAMVSTWCKAYTKQRINQPLSPDEQVMLRYEFVFYISLKHALAYVSVDEMITGVLVPNPYYQDTLPKVIQDESERCLIILDGLDEWTPPEGSEQMTRFVTEGLPSRRIMSSSTFLSTTRPWKLEVLRVRSSEIDYQVELTGINLKSSLTFTKLIVAAVKKRHGSIMSEESFDFKQVETRLSQFGTMPAILKQLVCLWHDGKPLGKSECDLYSDIINVMFELAELKGERLHNHQELIKKKKESSTSSIQLPRCFDGKTKCHEYRSLLYSLGRMAFELVFHQNRTTTAYIFDHSAKELFGMPKLEMHIFLKVGLLSSCKIIKDCTTRSAKLSFLHTTFQRFLAALYISTNSDNLHEHMGIMFSVCSSVEQILEMADVFVFVSGMNPDAAGTLSERIADIVSNDDMFPKYRHFTGSFNAVYGNLAARLQRMFVDCVSESFNNGYDDIRLNIEDIFILKDMNDSHASQVEHLIRTNLQHLNSLCIDAPLSPILEELVLCAGPLHKLVIGPGSGVTMKTAYALACNSKQTLCCLDVLVAAEPSRDYIVSLLYNLSYLKGLRLKNIKLTHSQIEKLVSFLAHSSQLLDIDLSNLWCTDCDFRCTYQLDLSQHRRLERLVLRYLYVDTVQLNTTEIQQCDVGYLWRQNARTSLMACLQRAPKLRFFAFDDYKANDILALNLPELSFLNLSDVNFGMKEFTSLLPALKNIKCIQMSDVTMTCISFTNMVNNLSRMDNPVRVVLYWVVLSPEEGTTRALDWIRASPEFSVTRYLDYSNGMVCLDFHTIKTL